MEDVPEPHIRDDEVLIRVRRAGVCGTDVHIYEWDDWAKSALQAAVRRGTRVRRRCRRGGPPRHRCAGRRSRHRRGPHRRRPLPALPHRQCARLPLHEDHRRRSRRLFRRVHRDARDERVAPGRLDQLRRRRHSRSDGQRVPHRAHRRHSRRDRAHHRLRPDWHLRRRHLQSSGRIACHRVRHQPEAPRAREADGRARHRHARRKRMPS